MIFTPLEGYESHVRPVARRASGCFELRKKVGGCKISRGLLVASVRLSVGCRVLSLPLGLRLHFSLAAAIAFVLTC